MGGSNRRRCAGCRPHQPGNSRGFAHADVRVPGERLRLARADNEKKPDRGRALCVQTDFARNLSAYCSSFAVIEIFAFKTLDTGQPFSAASAYFWKVAASAPGTRPTTSRWLAVIVQPESSFSRDSVTFVLMLS